MPKYLISTLETTFILAFGETANDADYYDKLDKYTIKLSKTRALFHTNIDNSSAFETIKYYCGCHEEIKTWKQKARK